jgi:hypothetical protein
MEEVLVDVLDSTTTVVKETRYKDVDRINVV